MVGHGADQGDEDADADDDVDHGEDLAGVGGGGDVAVADRGQGDHAEVEAVDPAEVFDEAVEHGAGRDDRGGDAEDGAACWVVPEASEAPEEVAHLSGPCWRAIGGRRTTR